MEYKQQSGSGSGTRTQDIAREFGRTGEGCLNVEVFFVWQGSRDLDLGFMSRGGEFGMRFAPRSLRLCDSEMRASLFYVVYDV